MTMRSPADIRKAKRKRVKLCPAGKEWRRCGHRWDGSDKLRHVCQMPALVDVRLGRHEHVCPCGVWKPGR